MNIRQAKECIKETVKIYLKKDEFGEYEIPIVKQRPIFLLGAPGVGKTAILEQIANELGVALVSYSMTHHTRQSAVGLPMIKTRSFDGNLVEVTEYTMSEIICTIYDTIEESGIKEGILFLDEINCVSETLAPTMLQFLQYKVFGRHKVPEGWVIVTAGNPQEFNKSVREFDVAVMDRLKVLNVEADYNTFKEYAVRVHIHPAIISFLDIKKQYFYRIENSVNGKVYVTARGWEDLSDIIKNYEKAGLIVDETLVEQYIRNIDVVKEFSAYYDLYNKYKRDYHVDEILEGNIVKEACDKFKKAEFDERLSLLSMLLDRLYCDVEEANVNTEYVKRLSPVLKGMKEKYEGVSLNEERTLVNEEILSDITRIIEKKEKDILSLKKASTISKEDERVTRYEIKFLKEGYKLLLDKGASFEVLKQSYNDCLLAVKKKCSVVSSEMDNVFKFAENAFGDGNEMLLLVTGLTMNEHTVRFIARHGCDGYIRHKDELMINDRRLELREEILEII